MPPRPFAVAGFSIFITLALLFYLDITAAFVLFGAAVAALLVLFAAKCHAVYRICAAAVAAGSLLMISTLLLSYYPAMDYAGTSVQLQAQLVDLPRTQYGKLYYTLKTSEIDGEKRSMKLRLVRDEALDVQPMDYISGEVQLFPLGEQSRESSRNYRSRGIYLGAWTSGDLQITPNTAQGPMYAVLRLRMHILNNLDRRMPGDAGGLAKALLLGDTTDVSPELMQNFSDTGISHLVSVSGFHLTVWAMALFRALEKLKVKKRYCACLSCLFVLLFMALACFSYSVTRSGIMLLLFLLGHIVSREADSLNNLGAALLLGSLLSPFSPGNWGLQLSAAATLGLLLFQGRLERPLHKKLAEWEGTVFFKKPLSAAWSMLCTTVAAMIPSLPFLLLLFRKLPLLCIPANLLMLTPASFCMIAGGLYALFPFADFLATATELSARYLMRVSQLLADLPFSVWNASSVLYTAFLAACCAAIALGLLVYRKNGKKMTKPLSLLLAGMFLVIAVGDSILRGGSTELMLADTPGGFTLCIAKQGRALLFLQDGEEQPASLSGSSIALDYLQVRKLQALLLPENLRKDNEKAAYFVSGYAAEQIFIQHDPAPLDSIRGSERFFALQGARTGLGEDCVLQFPADSAKCALLQASGVRVLLLFPWCSSAEIPQDWLTADLALCRGDVPPGLDLRRFALVLLASPGEIGLQMQEQLRREGVNAIACASQGAIYLRLYQGKTTAKRLYF